MKVQTATSHRGTRVPVDLCADFDIALRKAWRRDVPKVVTHFQRKLAQNPLFLQEAAHEIESKYMVAKAAAFQD